MNKSFRALFEEWASLLAMVWAREVDFPVLTAYRVALDGHLESVRAAKSRQLALQAEYRQATREVRQKVQAGADEVRRLRSQVRASLGPRDPRLRHFGIHPLKKRKPGARRSPRVSAPKAG